MFARTDRLLLRPIWAEDTPTLRQLGLAIPDTTPLPCSLPDLLVLRRTDTRPETVGRATLARTRSGKVALRIWIAPEARGRGYGRETACALIDMARHSLGLDLLIAQPARDDVAARRLCARLGFVRAAGDDVSWLEMPLEKDRKDERFCLAA